MAQINRVAPFLGFIFGTPFSGPAFEAIFVLELASQAYFFFSGPTASRQKIFWSTWMNVLWLCTWKGAEVYTVLRSVRGAVRASLSTQRSRMMLLASLSTDFGFNAILPQVIIANKTQFPIKFMKSLDPAITDRLKNWRGATAWNTAAFMCAYLRLLHERRQSYSPEKPLTLLFDCAACHLHSTVKSLAKTLGLQVLVVPVHFNRSMHIFFGGSGRRQRAKLLKALFPEKHGYV
jgi:hypothetical protein